MKSERPHNVIEHELCHTAWNIMRGENSINRFNLIVFLCSILNFDFEWMRGNESHNDDGTNIELIGRLDDNGNLMVNKKDIMKIHRTFKSFYINRTQDMFEQ